MIVLADLDAQTAFSNALLVILGILGLCSMLFWLWMAVDCLTGEHDSSHRVAWLLVLLLGSWIGALFYFFIRRRERIRLARQVALLGPVASAAATGPQFAQMPQVGYSPAKAGSGSVSAGPSAAWTIGTLLAVICTLLALPIVFLALVWVAGAVFLLRTASDAQRQLVERNLTEVPVAAVAPAIDAGPMHERSPIVASGLPVTDETSLATGDELLAQWGGAWYRARVQQVLENGEVEVQWVGWSELNNEVVPRSRLQRLRD